METFYCQYPSCTTVAVMKMSGPDGQINACAVHAEPFKNIDGMTFSAPDHGGLKGPHDENGIRVPVEPSE